MKIPIFAALLFTVLPGSVPATVACPPDSWDRAALLELKERQFRVDDASERQKPALALAAFLGSPDPVLRDGVAFEALSTWMARPFAIGPEGRW
jgi:hypothetical protein